MTMLHKATARAAGANPLVFIMSDATVDRYGDVIEPAGWKLGNFKRNPVALWGHDSDFPIGEWRNVRVEGGKLLGELQFLPAGRSARVDEIRAFVEEGMLRAVSVGFRPLEAEPMPGSDRGGRRFLASELVECSLVSIPANPNALQVAKSLNLSREAQELIFGKSADEIDPIVRRDAGEPASDHPSNSRSLYDANGVLRVKIGVDDARDAAPPQREKSMTLAERIKAAQDELVRLRDELAKAINDGGDIDKLTTDIETKDADLAKLLRAEKALGDQSGADVVVVTPSRVTVETKGADAGRRPFAAPAKKSEPKDLIIRSAVIQVLAQIERRSVLDVLQARYGGDESLKAMLDITTKAASAPATTTTTGWAAELVQTATLDFLDTLVASSVYPVLRDIGGRFTFGRNGVVSIPARSATPSIAGSFVGQGAPIPVRQAGFSASTLTPKKMAVITTFTREIAEKSTPDIEQVLRTAIQEDTGVAIDTVLLDNNAATTIRPAGLRNGVTGITAATGGGFNALVADLKALVGALITSSGGNIRKPVWIMNPVQALSISLTQNAAGDFPFAADLKNGILLGYPVAQSATVAAGTVALVDAADFFSATGDEPRFEVSDQAVLHMEDTTPLAISAAGTPNTVAAPIRSMFQTDSLALRMIMDLNWAMRRAGMVAFVTSVTW